MTTANFAFVLGVIFKCVSLYFVIIALFCLKKPAPYLKCKPVHRFAILIAARNEQGGKLQSADDSIYKTGRNRRLLVFMEVVY